jgi:phosphoribosylformylglycinamidine synthase
MSLFHKYILNILNEKFLANIDVMPLLGPQGSCNWQYENLDLPENVSNRPSHWFCETDALTVVAVEKVEIACKKLLANLIMENYYRRNFSSAKFFFFSLFN